MSSDLNFLVRPADIADAPEVLSIFLQAEALVVYKTGINLLSVVEWIDNATDEYPFLVVEHQSIVIGWCALEPFYGLPALAGAIEIGIYVDQSYHGKGAGKSMLNHVINLHKAKRLHSLIAYVLADNLQSQGFFRANGFQEWGCLPRVARSQGQENDLLLLGLQLD